jgi:hypothetical protein
MKYGKKKNSGARNMIFALNVTEVRFKSEIIFPLGGRSSPSSPHKSSSYKHCGFCIWVKLAGPMQQHLSQQETQKTGLSEQAASSSKSDTL